MAVISAILGGLAAVGHAIAAAASAVWGGLQAIGTAVAPSLVGGVTAATEGTGIGGALAGGIGLATVGGVAAAGVGVASAFKNARANAAADTAQQSLSQQGNIEVNKTATLKDRDTSKTNTLSSLRINLLPQKQTTEEVAANAFGVDTNNVVTTTANSVGLNIGM